MLICGDEGQALSYCVLGEGGIGESRWSQGRCQTLASVTRRSGKFKALLRSQTSGSYGRWLHYSGFHCTIHLSQNTRDLSKRIISNTIQVLLSARMMKLMQPTPDLIYLRLNITSWLHQLHHPCAQKDLDCVGNEFEIVIENKRFIHHSN
jgi:hypothetical protein